MKALLLIAHGSRRAESNTEIARLAERVAQLAERRFDIVEHAFLELAEPSIPDGIERCIEQGAREVRVLPYFLARGTHVAEDIPGIVDAKRAERPEIEIVVTDYLGTAEELPGLLLGLATTGPDRDRGAGDAVEAGGRTENDGSSGGYRAASIDRG